jgi:hypothetical protein
LLAPAQGVPRRDAGFVRFFLHALSAREPGRIFLQTFPLDFRRDLFVSSLRPIFPFGTEAQLRLQIFPSGTRERTRVRACARDPGK